MNKSALFLDDRKHRMWLLREWDSNLPKILFIGLNPSTANETDDDPTIRSVIRLAKFNGYGGAYMMNCFSYVSTDPKLVKVGWGDNVRNNMYLIQIFRTECKDYRTIEMEKEAIKKLISLYPKMIRSAKRKNNEFTIQLNV